MFTRQKNTKQVLTSSAIPAATSPAAPSAAAMVTLLPAVLLALAEPAEAAADDTAEASEGTRECVVLGAAEGAPLADTEKRVDCEQI